MNKNYLKKNFIVFVDECYYYLPVIKIIIIIFNYVALFSIIYKMRILFNVMISRLTIIIRNIYKKYRQIFHFSFYRQKLR